MYQVEVEITFPASHQLTLARTGQEPLHEHDWTVRVRLEGQNLDSDGLLVDFTKVKKLLAQIADKLAGQDLAKVADLAGENPSAEKLAGYFYQQLQGRFGSEVCLTGVSVQEAPGCWASYGP